MTGHVERRLAILNVTVVVAIVALIGIGTLVLLGQSLDREADLALASRIAATRDTLDNLPDMSPAGQGSPNTNRPDTGRGTNRADREAADDDEADDEDESDEEDDEESEEIVLSGDTLVFTFDDDGSIVTNRRNVVLNRIPDIAGVDAALEGETDTRIVTVDNENIRVRTEPVFHDGDVVGAIQAVRSESEHDDELSLVRTMTLVGTALGVVVAVPAAMYLTRRAIAPINEAMARQRAFVSDASHELRTPLTILRANAEMLTRDPTIGPDEMRQNLRAMIGDIDDMAHLVNDLLQLSRADSPDRKVDLQPVELTPLIARISRQFTDRAMEAGLTLDIDHAPARVRANGPLIEQVIRILLDNAIKYTPHGGTVSLRTRHDGSDVVIEVRDTGIGIPEQEQPLVFERFYRADPARHRSGGFGLGLPIARELTRSMGGTIELHSTPGTGTTIRLAFPAIHAPEPPASAV